MIDARIAVTLPSHPKTKKLIRRQGESSAWSLVCLFLWCAANRSDGDLSGMDAEDIEIAAGWTGEPGELMAALLEVGFIDEVEGAYSIHDWQQHNPWAAGAKDRSNASKWAALCKRYGHDGAAERMPEYAARMRPAHDEHAQSSEPDAKGREPHSEPHAPLPLPSPLPSPTPKAPTGAVRPKDFDGWYLGAGVEDYRGYPHKVAVDAAIRAWEKLRKAGKLPALKTLILATKAYTRAKPEDRPWKNPATWLAGGCWLDSPGDKPPSGTSAAGTDDEMQWTMRYEDFRRGKLRWQGSWGPEPNQRGCRLPEAVRIAVDAKVDAKVAA